MDSLLTAMISGIVAVVSPIITLYITRWYDRRELKLIKDDRQHALNGEWTGEISQQLYGQSVVLDTTVTFEVGSKVITGTIRVKVEVENQGKKEKIDHTLRFTGGVYHTQFIKIDYSHSDVGVRQFGSMILKIEDSGQVLTGKFTGYGSKSERIIGGDIVLKKSRDR